MAVADRDRVLYNLRAESYVKISRMISQQNDFTESELHESSEAYRPNLYMMYLLFSQAIRSTLL